MATFTAPAVMLVGSLEWARTLTKYICQSILHAGLFEMKKSSRLLAVKVTVLYLLVIKILLLHPPKSLNNVINNRVNYY